MVLEDGQLRRDQLDPQALGLQLQPIEALAGGDLACNQKILQAVLQGQGSQAQRDVVALNTALVLWSAGQVNSWSDGVQQAHASLASGKPWQRFEQLAAALTPVGG